jgi:hypothetical protein
MTILPTAVLTTTQLVGGLVASAKNALDLAKASSDHSLKASISELYDSLLDVKGRVLDLDEENRRLKTALVMKDEVVGPIEPHGYFFLKDKPNQPICPKCLQSQPSNSVFLSPLSERYDGARRECVICHWQHYETTKQPSGPVRRRSFSSLRNQR